MAKMYYTIRITDYGYWTVIFSAIELSEYQISYWRTQETSGLSYFGSRPQSIELLDIGLRKKYRLTTSRNYSVHIQLIKDKGSILIGFLGILTI
jgi:hypothetical protein